LRGLDPPVMRFCNWVDVRKAISRTGFNYWVGKLRFSVAYGLLVVFCQRATTSKLAMATICKMCRLLTSCWQERWMSSTLLLTRSLLLARLGA